MRSILLAFCLASPYIATAYAADKPLETLNPATPPLSNTSLLEQANSPAPSPPARLKAKAAATLVTIPVAIVDAPIAFVAGAGSFIYTGLRQTGAQLYTAVTIGNIPLPERIAFFLLSPVIGAMEGGSQALKTATTVSKPIPYTYGKVKKYFS
jgi:hypothetical protein